MNYGDICIKDEKDSLYFSRHGFELVFSKKSGELDKILFNGSIVSQNKQFPELEIVYGGTMNSDIKENEKNSTYPTMTLTGGKSLSDSKYIGFAVKRPVDGIILVIKVKCGEFDINKSYRFTTDNTVSRSLEINYREEGRVPVQYISWATMGIDFKANGFSEVEVPLGEIPGVKKAENIEEGREYGYPSSSQTNGSVYIHNEADNFCVTAWSACVRELFFTAKLIRKGDELNVKHEYSVNSYMTANEALILTDSYITVNNNSWRNNLEYVRDFYEHNGQSCNARCKNEIRGLLIYETEIGIVDFSENAKHCKYMTVDDLINDLENIADKGYNAIEIMPSFPYPGYTIVDLMNPELQHNTQGRLRELADKAHSYGIKIILDVLMHGVQDREIAKWDETVFSIREKFFRYWQTKGEDVNIIRKEHPDWFLYQDDGQIFKKYTWQLDHANFGVQNYFYEALKLYVEKYNVDGFRFDAPQWAGASNMRDDLDYLGAKSRVLGVWELFKNARMHLEREHPDIIWLNEIEALGWRDVTDAGYVYSSCWKWIEVFKGNITARQMQEFYDVRKSAMPKDMLYINYSDNHDMYFPDELCLFSYDKYSLSFSKALFCANLFAEGCFMSYAGYEDRFEDYCTKMQNIRRKDIFKYGDCSYSKARADSDNVFVILWTYKNEKLIVAVNFADKTENTVITVGDKKINIEINAGETEFVNYRQ